MNISGCATFVKTVVLPFVNMVGSPVNVLTAELACVWGVDYNKQEDYVQRAIPS